MNRDLYKEARARGVPPDYLLGASDADIRGALAVAEALDIAHSYLNPDAAYSYRRGHLDNPDVELYRWSMRNPHG